jgi:transposase
MMGARLLLEDVSDDEWAIVKRRIPQADSAKEAANPTIRRSVNAVLWRMRTGMPWRFIPAYYGESTSIFRRFQKWSGMGVWEDVTKLLAEMRSPDRRLAPVSYLPPPMKRYDSRNRLTERPCSLYKATC